MAKKQKKLLNGHKRTREDHTSETASDYAEAVELILHNKGECRLRDLAELFQISNASAHRAIARLKRQGLVESEPYGPIHLTRKGQILANQSQGMHQLVVDFLLAIGVPRESAEVDAEGLEHHISEDTEKAFRAFLQDRGLG
ncbi:MAG TPA: iron dependent repressor, metal binding and dimerization domain protein [Pirellula sp.]|nr:iron dependent repressor, metal binding and dimerization domain protein [Pirellula sp.]